MTDFATRHGGRVLYALSVALLGGAFVASTGLFNVDEVAYLAGAHAILDSGSFVVPNGFEIFRSDGLKLLVLVEGEGGLVPQYPAGTAVVGAVFVALLGARGLIVMNALAAVATLYATRALARRLFGSEAVALLAAILFGVCTFWVEYALGLWPHAIGVLCVTLALLFALRAFEPGGQTLLWAAFSGLSVGIGFLFRVDTALILPAIGAAALLFATRPMLVIAGGTLGLLPPLALAGLANAVKFGSFDPFSYGPSRSGGVDLMTHLAPLALVALTLLLLVALRLPAFRERIVRGRMWVAGLAAVAVLFVPALRDGALVYLNGAWALFADATAVDDPRPYVVTNDDGTVSFFGLTKKALGQSAPWLGLLFLPLAARPAGSGARAFGLGLVVTLVWTLPFVMREWHGGLGSNMRYFLPILPLLSALAAKVLLDLARTVPQTPRVLGFGALAGAASVALWSVLHPTGGMGAQQILSTYVFLAVAATALAVGAFPSSREVRAASLGTAGAGVAVGLLFGLVDLEAAQTHRATNAAASEATAVYEGPALMLGPPEIYAHQLLRPDQHVAVDRNGVADLALIRDALTRDHRVFAPNWLLDGILAEAPDLAVVERHPLIGLMTISEIGLRSPGTATLDTEDR